MLKPKFFQAELKEVNNVLDHIYPYLNGQITMTERMGSEEAECPLCGHNHWWLLPKESVAVNESGKPYIECLNCGYLTHL